MSDGQVYLTEHGWVAADDGGWTDEIYETEADARAAIGLPRIWEVCAGHESGCPCLACCLLNEALTRERPQIQTLCTEDGEP